MQARHGAGRATPLDTERARVLVASTAAGLPALEGALLRSRYRLAVLCGQAPTALDAELAAPRPLPRGALQDEDRRVQMTDAEWHRFARNGGPS